VILDVDIIECAGVFVISGEFVRVPDVVDVLLELIDPVDVRDTIFVFDESALLLGDAELLELLVVRIENVCVGVTEEHRLVNEVFVGRGVVVTVPD